MSVPASGGTPTQGAGEEVVEIPLHGDAAFAGLMDALAPEPEGGAAAPAAGGDGGAADAPAAGGTDSGSGGDAPAGLPTAGDTGADGGGGDQAGEQAQRADGADAGDPADAAADSGRAAVPADWTASAAELAPKLGELSTKLEENTSQAYQAQAYEAVRGEHGQYFDALEKHPRLLVGTQVPAIGKEGMETLRDTNDAREWQEAVKHLLVAEIQDRAGRQMEESRDFLATAHASIDLFKNNADLIPGTKDFDVELANEFVKLVTPYEVRVEGKLQGYSIPVQPIVDNLRAQIQDRRKATQAAAPAGTPTGSPPAAGAAPSGSGAQSAPERPQAGIPSKAGNSGEKEDFSTLFGTIGLPNLQI